MLKSNELRIGNYIYDDFNEVHIVEKIESEKYNEWNGSDPSLVVFSKMDDEYRGMYACDVVSGIPLTEEWLWKFGFEIKYGSTFFKGKMKFDINTIGLVRFHWSQKVIYVKYVHQLQNLYFALTGEELTTSLTT